MNTTICKAIKDKRITQFYYNGGIRDVEPFCHGEGTSGNELLRGYQVGGYNESGDVPGWRLFKVSEISSLSITAKHFDGYRSNYNPNDSAMSHIYCRI